MGVQFIQAEESSHYNYSQFWGNEVRCSCVMNRLKWVSFTQCMRNLCVALWMEGKSGSGLQAFKSENTYNSPFVAGFPFFLYSPDSVTCPMPKELAELCFAAPLVWLAEDGMERRSHVSLKKGAKPKQILFSSFQCGFHRTSFTR